MSSEVSFDDRGRALEDAFFRDQDKRLLDEMKASKERSQALADLKAVSGIAHDEVLVKLVDLGIRPQTFAALTLVPLVEVAWADGEISASERKALIEAAESVGIQPKTAPHRLLESWLSQAPPASMLATWETYAKTLAASLEPTARDLLRDDVIGRARRVAEAAGGFLGLVSKVSAAEQRILDRLAKAF
jgi:hypothetical protein